MNYTPLQWGPKISRSSTKAGLRVGCSHFFLGKGTNLANAGNWANQLDGVPK